MLVKHKMDSGLLLSVAFLFFIGVSFVYSASGYNNRNNLSETQIMFALRHFIFGLLGFLVMFWANSIKKIEDTRKFIKPLLFVVFVLLLITIIPGLGHKANNASRWIKIGPINFQPSELLKLAIIFFLADYIAKNINQMDNFKIGILKPMGFIGVYLLLIIKQPNLSAAVLIGLFSFTMLFIAGPRIKHIIMIGIVGVLLSALVISQNKYMYDRFMNWWDNSTDTQDKSFQNNRTRLAICTGGLTGRGFYNSQVKIIGLPEAHTDFIFAIIIEEVGLLGGSLILLVYLIMIIRCIVIINQQTQIYQKFLAIGITLFFCMHILVNLGVALWILPNTGITLPFISYGGTSLLVFMFCAGIMLNLSIKKITRIEDISTNVWKI